MRTIRAYHVIPALPPELLPLRELAYNILWSWVPEIKELFIRLDLELWDQSHNPVYMLGAIPQVRLSQAAQDESYLSELERVHRKFIEYIKGPTWFSRRLATAHFIPAGFKIAYFSAEFG